MKVQEAPRITIAEAFRRIKGAISADTSKRFADSIEVYVRDGPGVDAILAEGKIPEDSELHLEMISGKAVAIKNLRAAFHAFCIAESVIPRPLNMPWGGPAYGGQRIDEYEYDISQDEYERWAAPYLQKTTHEQYEKRSVNESDAHEEGAPIPKNAGGDRPTVVDVPWQDSARQIANELHKRDISAGAFSTPTAIAERVAPIMRERGIFGPQGPLAATTILREALSKRHWNRLK